MRLFFAALALAAQPVFADYIASNGVDSVLLTQKPCPADIAAMVPEEWREMAQLADAMVGGKHFRACYALRSDGFVIIKYEDDDNGAVPLSQFRESPEV